MLRKYAVLGIFVCGLAVVVGCKSKEQRDAEAAATKAEQDKFQGKWKIASRTGERDEDEAADEQPTGLFFVFENDIMKEVYVGKDGKEDVWGRKKMAFLTDKDPKGVDLTYVDDAGKPITANVRKGKGKSKRTTFKDVAVYKFDGDKLTLAISWDEKSRPTDFTAPPKSSRYILVLEKFKAGETPEPAKDDDKKGKDDKGKDDDKKGKS
jgi:uncharacterized protein (TIGR03067 family)